MCKQICEEKNLIFKLSDNPNITDRFYYTESVIDYAYKKLMEIKKMTNYDKNILKETIKLKEEQLKLEKETNYLKDKFIEYGFVESVSPNSNKLYLPLVKLKALVELNLDPSIDITLYYYYYKEGVKIEYTSKFDHDEYCIPYIIKEVLMCIKNCDSLMPDSNFK